MHRLATLSHCHTLCAGGKLGDRKPSEGGLLRKTQNQSSFETGGTTLSVTSHAGAPEIKDTAV